MYVCVCVSVFLLEISDTKSQYPNILFILLFLVLIMLFTESIDSSLECQFFRHIGFIIIIILWICIFISDDVQLLFVAILVEVKWLLSFSYSPPLSPSTNNSKSSRSIQPTSFSCSLSYLSNSPTYLLFFFTRFNIQYLQLSPTQPLCPTLG